MKQILILMAITLSFSLSAHAASAERNGDLATYVQNIRSSANLDARIKAQTNVSLAESMGEFNLDDFSVAWESLNCIATEGFDADNQQGVCTVNAGKFQLMAIASLVVKSNGEIEIVIIESEVE